MTRPPTEPGDLYVFPPGGAAALEWLVVRPHPDDAGLLFVVPVDDYPRAGTPDVALAAEVAGRPRAARCGQGLWIAADRFEERHRAGRLADEALRLVRQKLADLARGRITSSDEQRAADDDSDYAGWMEDVEAARQRLEEPPGGSSGNAKGPPAPS